MSGLKWLWLSAVVFILDQSSKLIFEALLVLHEPVVVLPFFDLRKTYNLGAAFSFLSDASGWQRWFFTGLAVLVIAILVNWLRKLPANQTRMGLSLALIVGGAAGNLVDRLAYGHVIDFIDLYYGDWHWPTFNIADSAITIGAVLYVLDTLIVRKKPPPILPL